MKKLIKMLQHRKSKPSTAFKITPDFMILAGESAYVEKVIDDYTGCVYGYNWTYTEYGRYLKYMLCHQFDISKSPPSESVFRIVVDKAAGFRKEDVHFVGTPKGVKPDFGKKRLTHGI